MYGCGSGGPSETDAPHGRVRRAPRTVCRCGRVTPDRQTRCAGPPGRGPSAQGFAHRRGLAGRVTAIRGTRRGSGGRGRVTSGPRGRPGGPWDLERWHPGDTRHVRVTPHAPGPGCPSPRGRAPGGGPTTPSEGPVRTSSDVPGVPRGRESRGPITADTSVYWIERTWGAMLFAQDLRHPSTKSCRHKGKSSRRTASGKLGVRYRPDVTQGGVARRPLSSWVPEGITTAAVVNARRPPSDQPCAPFCGGRPGEGRPRARPLSVGDRTRLSERHSHHAGVPSRPGQGRPRASRTDRDARRASAHGEVCVRDEPEAVTRRQRAGQGEAVRCPAGSPRVGFCGWCVTRRGGGTSIRRGPAEATLHGGSEPGRPRPEHLSFVTHAAGSGSLPPGWWKPRPGHRSACLAPPSGRVTPVGRSGSSGSRVCGLAPPAPGRVTLEEAGSPRSDVPTRRGVPSAAVRAAGSSGRPWASGVRSRVGDHSREPRAGPPHRVCTPFHRCAVLVEPCSASSSHPRWGNPHPDRSDHFDHFDIQHPTPSHSFTQSSTSLCPPSRLTPCARAPLPTDAPGIHAAAVSRRPCPGRTPARVLVTVGGGGTTTPPLTTTIARTGTDLERRAQGSSRPGEATPDYREDLCLLDRTYLGCDAVCARSQTPQY